MLPILEKPEMLRQALPVSVQGYEKMGELGLVGEKTELIRGVIFEKMSKSPLHSGLIRKFIRALHAALDDRHFISSEQPLRLSDSCPEPDVAVIRGNEDEYLRQHPAFAQLVIEVAVSSETLDREKGAIYAEAGIPEYWLVLPDRQVIERFSAPVQGNYRDHFVAAAADLCRSVEFPCLQVRLGEWLA